MEIIMYTLLPLCLALYLFARHLLHKLQNLPPTPFLSFPIIGHLYLLKRPLHRRLADISGRHGPLVFLRLGSRPSLLVSSPSLAEECLTKHDVVFANRPRLIAGKYIGYDYTSLAWSNYGDHWRNLRRIASLEILSSRRIQMLSEIRADEVRSMVRWLWENENKQQVVNVKALLFEVATNVMMRMIAGKRYYGGENTEETVKFQEMIAETLRLGDTTNVGDYLPMLRWVGVRGKEEELKELQRKRDMFMQKLIEEHRRRRMETEKEEEEEEKNNTKKKRTMIEVMLSLQEKEPDYYTDKIIRGLMLVMFGAGTDTTSITIEWALSLLLNNPNAMKKAQAEMDNKVGDKRLIQESDLLHLPYLQCVIKEAQRMYPAGPIIPHESSEECRVGGHRVPRGTMLLVNIWAIQNDPAVWEEPRKFMPERFEAAAADEKQGLGLRMMPFGAGRRGCPGEGLALRMVGLVLGSLIQCFDWESTHVLGEEERKEGKGGMMAVDMTEGTGLTLPKARPLMLRCKPRPPLRNLFPRP